MHVAAKARSAKNMIAPNMTPESRAQAFKDFREPFEPFNQVLEHQADRAPRSISLKDAQLPVRDGNLLDFLRERQLFDEIRRTGCCKAA